MDSFSATGKFPPSPLVLLAGRHGAAAHGQPHSHGQLVDPEHN